MPAYYSANQLDKYLHYKSGATLLLCLGRELSKLGNDVFTKTMTLDLKEREAIQASITQWQQDIIKHFETGNGVSSNIGHYIFTNPEHTVSLVKLNIVSLIFYKLIYENQCSVALGCILSGCSAGDKDYSPLTYRQVVGALLVDGILVLAEEERSNGLGGFVALSRGLLEALVGKFCVPFFTSKDIGVLRAAKQEKLKKAREKKLATMGHAQKATSQNSSGDPMAIIPVQEMIKKLSQIVVGQERQISQLCAEGYVHCLRRNALLRSEKDGSQDNEIRYMGNRVCVLGGKSGSGKSFAISNYCHLSGLTYVDYPCNSITASGYVGSSVEDPLRLLLEKSNNDIGKARFSILFLDEADKLGLNGAGNSKDVGGTCVQQELLKCIEGTPNIELDTTWRRRSENDAKTFNSIGLMTVLAGAFTELEDRIHYLRKKNSGLGFANENVSVKNPVLYEGLLTYFIPEILIGF